MQQQIFYSHVMLISNKICTSSFRQLNPAMETKSGNILTPTLRWSHAKSYSTSPFYGFYAVAWSATLNLTYSVKIKSYEVNQKSK